MLINPRGHNPLTESSTWWKNRTLALWVRRQLFGRLGSVTLDSCEDSMNKRATLQTPNVILWYQYTYKYILRN